MTATHPCHHGYTPTAVNGRHKAHLWSPLEERHTQLIQEETGVLAGTHKAHA